MGTEAEISRAVRDVWGYDTLRPLQMEAIRAGVEGRDCLIVMPTGGGKSLCYQAPPLVTGRVTVVLSPLIALMRDQVRGLALMGYPAAALHSALDHHESREIERRLLEGEIRLVLVAPERAMGPGFKSLLARLADRGMLGAIAIDEAHCISQWGHDFRPEYRRMRELREVAPGVSVQAFTATATPRVRVDIASQLALREPGILVGSFDRPNLTYRVERRSSAAQQAGAIIRRVTAESPGGAIVYCISRKDTEELAEELGARGLSAEAYHAGLAPRLRSDIEERFTGEELDVVVATVAFGMGIDRSNVRAVVHAAMPKSVEAYQQEAGRAGRDGLGAECVMLYGAGDASRWERLITRGASDGGAEATRAQLELVGEMRRFVGSMACRHRLLCEHFGQAYTPPDGRVNCGACDVCLGEHEPVDQSTRVCQILMSAVARTGQRYGAAHIADIARGSQAKRVRDAGHDALKVFGLLRAHAKHDIVGYLDQLIAAGALESRGEYATLVFGERGVEVMKGEDPIELVRPSSGAGAGAPARQRAPIGPMSAEERELFDRLRGLRKTIAGELGVPPYMVFSDATLRELCRDRPSSSAEFLRVKGVGPFKADAFGARFLKAINEPEEDRASEPEDSSGDISGEGGDIKTRVNSPARAGRR